MAGAIPRATGLRRAGAPVGTAFNRACSQWFAWESVGGTRVSVPCTRNAFVVLVKPCSYVLRVPPYSKSRFSYSESRFLYSQSRRPYSMSVCPYVLRVPPDSKIVFPYSKSRPPYSESRSPYSESHSPYSESQFLYSESDSSYSESHFLYSHVLRRTRKAIHAVRKSRVEIS